MPLEQTAAGILYKGWEHYQRELIEAISPLSPEQLALRAAPNLRSVGEIGTHIVSTRAGWFYNAVKEGDDEIAALAVWEAPGAPSRTAEEIVAGLRTTWRLMSAALERWTPEELVTPFNVERRGREHTFTRQWIIWHLIEHDLHHGGELAFSLGMHGLPAPNI